MKTKYVFSNIIYIYTKKSVSPEEEIDLMLYPMEESEIRAQRHQLHYQRTGEENTLKTAISNFIFSRNNRLFIPVNNSFFLLSLSHFKKTCYSHTT